MIEELGKRVFSERRVLKPLFSAKRVMWEQASQASQQPDGRYCPPHTGNTTREADIAGFNVGEKIFFRFAIFADPVLQFIRGVHPCRSRLSPRPSALARECWLMHGHTIRPCWASSHVD